MNKKILIGVIIIAIAIIFINIAKNKKQESPEQDYTVVSHAYEKINIIGETAENGAADPSIEYGEDGVGWMAYSAVDGISNISRVHTHLAKTTDNGQTWTYVKEINPSINGELTLDDQIIKGVWWNEVSTLVHDPDDIGKEWKLYWHKYFSKGKTSLGAEARVLVYGWIAYKHASTPEGLADAEEIPLFGAGPFPLKPYSTKINLSQLHPNLSEFIVYTEPGSLYKDGIIYLTLQGHVIKNKQNIAKIVLIASDDHGETWRYVNTLVENKDARDFGASYFTASSLVRENSQFFLFVSPENPESKDKSHLGTVIFEFEDIEQGILKKDKDGELIVYKYLQPSLANGGGQSDYDEQNTYGGIMMPQTNIPAYPKVGEIHNTKQRIADYLKCKTDDDCPQVRCFKDKPCQPYICISDVCVKEDGDIEK